MQLSPLALKIRHARRRLMHWRRQVTDRPAFRIGTYIVIVALISAWGLHLVERYPPEDNKDNWPYSTYLGTVQQVGILLFSGFDAEQPRHPIGFVLAMFCLFLGIAMLALLTADIATVLITAAMAGRGRRQITIRDHIIICGWNHTARSLVEHLVSLKRTVERDIVVIDCEIDNTLFFDPEVHFVHGSPTEMEVLRRANTEHAHTAIVPIDARIDEDLQDSQTVLATLALKSANPNIYLCMEVLRAQNLKHVQRTGADEAICVGDFSKKLLTHAATTHGLTRLLDEVLTFDVGSEIYKVPLPGVFAGRSFRWLLSQLNARRSAILLAVERVGEVHTNPLGEFIFEQGDEIFVMSEEYPDNLERLME